MLKPDGYSSPNTVIDSCMEKLIKGDIMRKEYDFTHARRSTYVDEHREVSSNVSKTVDEYMKVPYRIPSCGET